MPKTYEGLGFSLLLPDAIGALPERLQPDTSEGFDAAAFPPLGADAALAVRLIGFATVTPFVEELFVRSFLIRLVDVIDTGGDFRDVPVARYALRSFVVTVLWFTFTHVPWEWIVALPSGVIFNLWLYRRGHIGAPIVAHAVANLAIGLHVAFGPESTAYFL